MSNILLIFVYYKMNDERTNYDKQMNQIYQVYTPQGAGANFTCAGWCKSQGLGPPVTGTWMGTAPICGWSCGDLTSSEGTFNQDKTYWHPKIAFKRNEPKYTCSACLAANDWNTYVGLNPSNPYLTSPPPNIDNTRPGGLEDADLGGHWVDDFGDSCDTTLNGWPNEANKVCCCDGTPYTGPPINPP